MFDIGWSELLIIGIVALIVVGPKDLPGMFRTLGRFSAKIREMGREFQRAMDAAANESGVKDVASDLRKAANPAKAGLDALKDAARSIDPRTPSPSPPAKSSAPLTPAGAGTSGADAPAASAPPKASPPASAAAASAQTDSAAAGSNASAAGTPSGASPSEPQPTPDRT